MCLGKIEGDVERGENERGLVGLRGGEEVEGYESDGWEFFELG
jgi:hypothetical protein